MPPKKPTKESVSFLQLKIMHEKTKKCPLIITPELVVRLTYFRQIGWEIDNALSSALGIDQIENILNTRVFEETMNMLCNADTQFSLIDAQPNEQLKQFCRCLRVGFAAQYIIKLVMNTQNNDAFLQLAAACTRFFSIATADIMIRAAALPDEYFTNLAELDRSNLAGAAGRLLTVSFTLADDYLTERLLAALTKLKTNPELFVSAEVVRAQAEQYFSALMPEISTKDVPYQLKRHYEHIASRRKPARITIFDIRPTLDQLLVLVKHNPLKCQEESFVLERGDRLATLIRSHLVRYSKADHPALKDSALNFFQDMRVSFNSEIGVDGGGLKKEALSLCIRSLCSADYFSFRESNGFVVPHQAAMNGADLTDDFREECTLIGVLMGICLINGFIIDDLFPAGFYHLLVSDTMTGDDALNYLEELDPQVKANLEKLQLLSDDVLAGLDLDFTATVDCFGYPVVIDLRPGKPPVTRSNLQEYVSESARFYFSGGRALTVANCVRAGLEMVVFRFRLRLFTAENLRLALCGRPVIDLDQLKSVATYSVPFTAEHRSIKLFWQCLEELNQTDLSGFCKFAFASPRPPVGGFRRLVIQRSGGKWPTAHTCASILDLPAYDKIEDARAGIALAVRFCEGFGVV